LHLRDSKDLKKGGGGFLMVNGDLKI